MNIQEKRTLGLVSFAPLLAWSVTLAYVITINKPLNLSQPYQNQSQIVTNLSDHFGMMSLLFGIIFIVTTGLVYFYVIYLARLKQMHAINKLGWMIFITIFTAIAFPIIWFAEVRKHPEHVEMYPNII